MPWREPGSRDLTTAKGLGIVAIALVVAVIIGLLTGAVVSLR